MKEYKVQMEFNGKWILAHTPHNFNNRTFKDKDSAEQFTKTCITRWDEYYTKYRKYTKIEQPKKYRIIVREVTEWEEA